MFNMNTNKDSIMSTMEGFGLTMDDVIVLMKGYEKFTESSANEKKELMRNIKSLIRVSRVFANDTQAKSRQFIVHRGPCIYSLSIVCSELLADFVSSSNNLNKEQ